MPELLDGCRTIHPDYTPGDLLIRAMMVWDATPHIENDPLSSRSPIARQISGPIMMNLAPKSEHVFTIEALCTPPEELGIIDGGTARMIPITGGSVSGPKFSGTVMPGADWSIMRDDGLATVEARYAIKAEDGTIIQVFNGAKARIDPSSMATSGVAMITSPRFIAPEGPHAWLNEGVYVGALMPDMSGGSFAVRIAIYRLTPQ